MRHLLKIKDASYEAKNTEYKMYVRSIMQCGFRNLSYRRKRETFSFIFKGDKEGVRVRGKGEKG